MYTQIETSQIHSVIIFQCKNLLKIDTWEHFFCLFFEMGGSLPGWPGTLHPAASASYWVPGITGVPPCPALTDTFKKKKKVSFFSP
jgi:hypothetical protein